MTAQEQSVAGRRCALYTHPNAPRLLIQPVDTQELDALNTEIEEIRRLSPLPFSLAAFAVSDWQRDLSPWKAPPAAGGGAFGGRAADTLAFVLDDLLPALPCRDAEIILGGYSLAGLFALWSGFQTRRFAGVAAVSPSVWFPGWDAYMQSRTMLARAVYFSLGLKEEKTRNPLMSPVGDRIRQQAAILARSHGERTTLEWNPGGHFREPERRVARGFAWVCGALERQDEIEGSGV